MSARCRFASYSPCALGLLLVAISLPAWGGNVGFRSAAVGGVMIDTKGVLSNAAVDDLGRLRNLRQQMLQPVASDLKQPTKLRKVSLRALDAAIADRKRKTEMPLLTDEMHYLAGLTRIQYVFVYPELNDIVIAGPAEGWKVDDKGAVVGASTGLPILQLDHLLVALRTAEGARDSAISCSIDPTEEGVQRFKQFMKTQSQFSPEAVTGIEQALGLQNIRINGVSDASDFARIMVAADFRMKRLGMGFDKSPVRGLPSYLEMVTAAGVQSAMPRWWMAPHYEALLKDPDGMAWELRGQGVKCLTEDSIFAADGTRKSTGKSGTAAQRWADLMTEHYDELCVAEPVFGELRNIMDMAVISALVVQQRLQDKANCPLSVLMSPQEIAVDDFPAPKQVDSKASAVKKGRNWIISASGGVEINSWEVAQRTETATSLSPIHKQARKAQPTSWHWD